jgi:hypothetical protein
MALPNIGADVLQGSAAGKSLCSPFPTVEGLAKVRSVRQVEGTAADLATLHATFPAPTCGRISRVAQQLVLAHSQQDAGPSRMDGKGEPCDHEVSVTGGIGHVDGEVAENQQASEVAATPRDQVIATFNRGCVRRPWDC